MPVYTDRFQTTEVNPSAAADAYMAFCRGFNIQAIAGWYRQGAFAKGGMGSATVRFDLDCGATWERIIDQPHRFGKQKANFIGQYQGHWWQAPGMDLTAAKEIWITEGIFDAISLILNGQPATSTLSCNNYPSEALSALSTACALAGVDLPTLVFAYDTGKAGESFTRKFVKRAREEGWEAHAAQPPRNKLKLDWNELHHRERLTEKDLKEYRYYGDLLTAEKPGEKALLIYHRKGWNSFDFEFDHRLYWFKLDAEKHRAAFQSLRENERYDDRSDDELRELALTNTHSVTDVANCHPEPLYYLRNEVTDEAWYYFRVAFPHDGSAIKATFTAGQLSAPSEFKKRLLHVARGAIWTGNAGQLDKLLSKWTYNIKKVETIDFTGYSLEHKCYVFNEVAIAGGKVIPLNDEDYYEVGSKLSIKTLQKSIRLDLNTDSKADRKDWLDLLHICFGAKGTVALANWLGSLFAEQIRHRFESYPFVEIVGEPGAGKTTLIEFLWKLLGRANYEGFDPLKASQVAVMRSMAQVANLPVVLIESDRSDESGDGSKGRPKQAFNWDGLKSLYNGGALRATGMKTSGNDTYEPQFRGALIVSQNAPIAASPAIMERLVHIWFDKSRQSEEGREAGLTLGRISPAEVSHFLIRATTQEDKVLALIEERQRGYEKQIAQAGVRNLRVQKNHAQLMALCDALPLAAPVTPAQVVEAKQLLIAMAIEREDALAKDHPVIEQFWEAFDHLNGDPNSPLLNHASDAGMIAVNLNEFEEEAGNRRQRIPTLTELKKVLKTSRTRKFVGCGVVSSKINRLWNAIHPHAERKRPESVRCWIFEAAK